MNNHARPRLAHGLAIVVVTLVTVVAGAIAPTPAHASGWISAHWPGYSQPLNRDLVVTGHVEGRHLGDVVALQRRVSGGAWQTVARDRLNSYRNYRLEVPSWWLGYRVYRVVSVGGSERRATPARSFNIRPAYRATGYSSQYRWASSTPTRWDPCSVIGWRVNVRRATPGALRDARVAFRRLSAATGLRFAYRGTTTGVPQYGGNSWYPSDTQIVVAWARRHESSLFGLYPGAVGVGAAMSSSGYYNASGARTNRITKGMVVIDSTKIYRGGFAWGRTRGDILLHELGHTMGLGHTSATSQIMYPYVTSGYARYGRGDLRAMFARGTRNGCLTRSSGGFNSLLTLGGGIQDAEPAHIHALH